jgi:hypothetical protein
LRNCMALRPFRLLDDETAQGLSCPPVEITQEGFMRTCLLLALTMAGLTLSACSNTEWVHPNKPSGEYINDYNKCETQAYRDPKLQQGSQLMILNATERCMQREGWRLVEH